MSFWVSWMAPVKRARIHQAECRHCNNGRGKAAHQPCYSSNTGWRGPYRTMAEAEHVLDLIVIVDGYDDTGKCRCIV